MNDNCMPRCPKCGRPTGTPTGSNEHTFWCSNCQILFEDVDDGTIGRGRPDRIAENREEFLRREDRRRRDARGYRR